jgi:amino acid transporter
MFLSFQIFTPKIMDILQYWPYLVIFLLCVIGYRLWRIQNLLAESVSQKVPKTEKLSPTAKKMIIGTVIILIISIILVAMLFLVNYESYKQ